MNNFLEIKNQDIIKLSPKFLDANLKEHILKTLKSKYEGLCSKFGYIKSNSIRVLNIKEGVVERSTFHGYVKFNIEFSSLICNPAINSVIKCTIKNINSFGILCISGIKEDGVFNSVLNIIVPKNHHNFEISNNIEFDKLSINDNVNVEILGKKYILNNKNINVFGRIVDNNLTTIDNIMTGNNEEKNNNSSDEDDINSIEDDNDNDNDNENENDSDEEEDECEGEINVDGEIEGGGIVNGVVGEVDVNVEKRSNILEDDKSEDDNDDILSETNSVSDNEETFD